VFATLDEFLKAHQYTIAALGVVRTFSAVTASSPLPRHVFDASSGQRFVTASIKEP
jgi:hypothetical protein